MHHIALAAELAVGAVHLGGTDHRVRMKVAYPLDINGTAALAT
jgi:hypothetical protein